MPRSSRPKRRFRAAGAPAGNGRAPASARFHVDGYAFRGERDGGVYDAVGIGAGPFNLSLAALLDPLKELRARFYERAPEVRWHPGLMLPEATIQVSYLKDLVTLADPTSRYSFLQFLAEHRRLYRFINAAFPRVARREFEQYLRWVARSLPSLAFGAEVRSVELEGDHLVVEAGAERVRTHALVLGTGLTPEVPECARPFVGERVFHAYTLLAEPRDWTGKAVAVVGSGQTGAEVVRHLLSDSRRLPSSVTWVSRRGNFHPLDDSPFANELFTPAYAEHFSGLCAPERERLLDEQRLASDGISMDLLADLYRRLYELEFLEERGRPWRLLPGRALVGMGREADGSYALEVAGRGERQAVRADVVVLATGAAYRLPACLEPLAARIGRDGAELAVREDFSVEWDGPPGVRIFAQNAGRRRRGVAEPNLSLMAWRSARIANALARRHVYDVADSPPLVEWEGAPSFNGAHLHERDPHAGAVSPA
ncbi:MAG TPA: SidA/IucD/PvdA family monooxygenase [Longimicrobium sp.]|nr:SidA/IucD/PvdA family monooxygenase [Longimicrobium sp.]